MRALHSLPCHRACCRSPAENSGNSTKPAQRIIPIRSPAPNKHAWQCCHPGLFATATPFCNHTCTHEAGGGRMHACGPPSLLEAGLERVAEQRARPGARAPRLNCRHPLGVGAVAADVGARVGRRATQQPVARAPVQHLHHPGAGRHGRMQAAARPFEPAHPYRQVGCTHCRGIAAAATVKRPASVAC